MAYTNCDTVELFVNGKSFGMKSIDFPRQGNSGGWNRYDQPLINNSTGDLHLTWDVPYAAGTVKAVGRKGGKIVVEEAIQTTGVPAGIRLSTDRNTIHADGTDVSHIKVEIIDEKGNMVPDANNNVTLTVEGAGNLIGFDNGSPRDHTSMKSPNRNAFNGLALAVVQSGSKPGTVAIRAISPGIKEGAIQIVTGK
jgi:beta-galactosidase